MSIQKISNLIRARFPLIYVTTYEEEDVIDEEIKIEENKPHQKREMMKFLKHKVQPIRESKEKWKTHFAANSRSSAMVSLFETNHKPNNLFRLQARYCNFHTFQHHL